MHVVHAVQVPRRTGLPTWRTASPPTRHRCGKSTRGPRTRSTARHSTPHLGLTYSGGHIFVSGYRDTTPWLSVDLGAPAAIARVVIWNRCDDWPGAADRLQNAELRIGNASITAAPADTERLPANPLVWKQTASIGWCAPKAVTFATPVVGRWVTLQNLNTAGEPYLHITELQVFGVYPAGW